jgi:hypothetical protein
MLHRAPHGAVLKALSIIKKLPSVKSQPVLLRVEHFE